MLPTLPTGPDPLGAVAGSAPRVAESTRLDLDPVPGHRGAAGGTWWLHSRDVAGELLSGSSATPTLV
ncbi:hypothetical protein [Nonomuraea sp. NPDC050691]|uniref:hypothetical protein n=1 Tax=Nonomuraea sp. NPDC050691 TaxID=3155661 RepID=UPI0033DBFFAF